MQTCSITVAQLEQDFVRGPIGLRLFSQTKSIVLFRFSEAQLPQR